MDIAVLALPGTYPSSLATWLDAFHLVRRQVRIIQKSRAELEMETRLRRLTPDGRSIVLADGTKWTGEDGTANDRKFAAIHLPAFEIEQNAMASFLAEQSRILHWLREQHECGALISASGGAIFLLAQAGLLRGHTNWAPPQLTALFRQRYPAHWKIESDDLVETGKVLAARTMAAELRLMTRLVERLMTPGIAGWLARTVGLAPGLGDALSDDPVVADAQIWLGERYALSIRIRDAATALGVSQQTLIRRFRKRLDMTPRNYLQHLRIEAAKLQLEHSARPIGQIATVVGYDDLKSFRAAFRDRVGMSASGFRKARRQT